MDRSTKPPLRTATHHTPGTSWHCKVPKDSPANDPFSLAPVGQEEGGSTNLRKTSTFRKTISSQRDGHRRAQCKGRGKKHRNTARRTPRRSCSNVCMEQRSWENESGASQQSVHFSQKFLKGVVLAKHFDINQKPGTSCRFLRQVVRPPGKIDFVQPWHSVFAREGQPRRQAGRFAGVALQDARRSKERTYPEVFNNLCRRMVLAIEVGGKVERGGRRLHQQLSTGQSPTGTGHPPTNRNLQSLHVSYILKRPAWIWPLARRIHSPQVYTWLSWYHDHQTTVGPSEGLSLWPPKEN